MKALLILLLTVSLAASANIFAAETVSVAGELARMRSADHLFRPQSHRILQYSGFHREGGNPDRLFCLYEEDG